MRRLLAVLTAGAAAFGVGLAPAKAITGNFRPDFEHDYVGLIVFYDAMGTPSHRCSRSLLTDTSLTSSGRRLM